MSTKKATMSTGSKYVDLISKTEKEKQSDEIALNVESAQIAIKQGQLSIESKLIGKKGDLKSAEVAVKNAERALQATKSYIPFNVQALLNARTNLQQAILNVEAREKEYNEYEAAYEFLIETEKELF